MSFSLVFRVTTALAVAAALMVSPPATAPSEADVRQVGQIVRVNDGDTYDVRSDYDRDGDKEIKRVRLIGADSPETGQCGYQAAKDFAKSLLLYSGGAGRTVTMTSDLNNAVGIKDRIQRRVAVHRSDGTRLDIAAALLTTGNAWWMPFAGQPTNNQLYHARAERAAVDGRGIYGAKQCGPLPSPRAKIQMDVQWETDDNGVEHARITNIGTGPLDIDGWRLRAGGIRTKYIPGGFDAIAMGETVRVYAKSGTSTRLNRYLGSGMMWPDVDLRYANGGDGGYLVDPKGNVRAWQIYKCTINCLAPANGARGRVTVTDWEEDPDNIKKPDGTWYNGGDYQVYKNEYVELTNTSIYDVDVSRLVVDIEPFTVELHPGLVLKPGEHLVVRSGRDEDLAPYAAADGARSYEYFLNARYAPLTNIDKGGDRVVLRTYAGKMVACQAWGARACPSS